jgi:hypothetical protein
MRINPYPNEPVYLRFIGIFVLAVGLSYLYPLAGGTEPLRMTRLSIVWEVTALIRGAVSASLLAFVLLGLLPVQWLTVTLCDGTMATIQFALITKGIFHDDIN